MEADIVGREAELSALSSFLDVDPSGAGALLLEGEAGIGKSTLWGAGCETARRHGYRVLTCRPAESEVRLSFASLGDLLDGVLTETLAALPGPQRRALEIALLLEESGGAPPDQRAIGLGLRGALRFLAEGAPLLVAIDDRQWLDRASASALEFALRRIDTERVRVLATVRIEHGGTPLKLEQLFPDERLQRLRVAPLTLGALQRLVRTRLGAPLPRTTLLQLHGASGGNPFFALEIARALGRRGRGVEAGERLPLPDNLDELVRERLAALSRPVQKALRVVAALSDPTVSAVEAGLGPESKAAALLETAAAAGVVEFEGERVRFTHPLLASGVYSRMARKTWRELHRRLAAISSDQEARARHLALAAEGPDESVAAAVEESAGHAFARGAPGAAAELAEQARRLTPEERRRERFRRSLAAAAYHASAGDGPSELGILEELVATLPAGPERAQALQRLAFATTDRPTLELAERALAEAGDEPALRAEIHFTLARLSRNAGELARAETHAERAGESAEASGRDVLLAEALSELGVVRAIRGQGVQRDLMGRALALVPAAEVRWLAEGPNVSLALQLMWAGDLGAARARLEAEMERVVRLGWSDLECVIAARLAMLEIRAGNWDRADQWAAESRELALQATLGNNEPLSLFARSLVDAQIGKTEDARSAAHEGIASAKALGDAFWAIQGEAILGFLALSLGDAALAHDHLGPVVEALRRMGVREPGVVPALSDEIEALIALAELEHAEALLADLEERGRTLDRAWALAAAARCRGLLLVARGDLEIGVASLQESLALHDRDPSPFERARTLLALGASQRRGKKKRAARESLEHARAMFEQLGAELWAGKARAELARIGGRAPSSGELTPTQWRVAKLVAEGKSNKEVASELFVTVKTVQANLSKVYAKLGVRSRAELAYRLARKE